jgi:hypothetical protein
MATLLQLFSISTSAAVFSIDNKNELPAQPFRLEKVAALRLICEADGSAPWLGLLPGGALIIEERKELTSDMITFLEHSTAQRVFELKKKSSGFSRRAPEKGPILTLESTRNARIFGLV